MLIALKKATTRKAGQQGFTLIELLIVVLIVGILAAIGIPLYIGYINDAKSAEGKTVAGALWTALQSNALANCGSAALVSGAQPKAGLGSGSETSKRWDVVGGGNTLTVTCGTGAYTPSANPLFTISGKTPDISAIQVNLVYDGTKNPPSKLTCVLDGSTTPADC
jgi:prepilin-type N-terminal cleavage/methylation domain-containing protein